MIQNKKDYFDFFYEGTRISIRRDNTGQYVFSAAISLDARIIVHESEALVCTREAFEKAVMLTKQKDFEGLKEKIEFDPDWQEWHMGLEYPYLHLDYSMNGETYSLHDSRGNVARITFYSPAFPAVMELLHELALLYQETKPKTFSQEMPVPIKANTKHKVHCPFCDNAIRPKSHYCSACGNPLPEVGALTLTEEEVDLEETIHLCAYCKNDISWKDTYCRNCGKALRK